MSRSPELLFPDDDDVVETPLPPRPRGIAQPIAKRVSSAVAPAGPSKPKAPLITIFNPARIKMRTSREAFRINPYSTKGYSLTRGKIPTRAQGPYMPGGRRTRRRRSTRRKARMSRSRKA